MWFCLDDNSCCVLGDVCDYVKGKLQVPKVWPIFTGIRFIQMEVARFACSCPCGGSWWESKCKWHSNSKHDNKIILCASPKKDNDNKRLFGKHLKATILRMQEVPNPGYGWVYSIESNGGMMTMTYEMTIGLIPNYTYHDFVSMLTNSKNKRKFVPCKHLYFIFKTWMFCDHKTNDFINQPTLSINEVKKLL